MAGSLGYAELEKSSVQQYQLDDLSQEVNRLKTLTGHIPSFDRNDPQIEQNVMKAWQQQKKAAASRGPKSAFFDPLSLQYAMGYKDRRYSLTYDTLKRISNQLGIVASIINTRINQVSSFAQPYRTTKSLGFAIKHKDPEHLTTDGERDFIKMLESFMSNCGEPGVKNPHIKMRRPDFEGFLKMVVRDTLTFDQLGFEVVPRNNRIPFEFWAVDASTLRIASTDRDVGYQFSYHDRNTKAPLAAQRFLGMYEGQQYGMQPGMDEHIHYVQVVNGQIENVYSDEDLAFGVRNPRTDIYVQGYGYGELEQLVTIVTSLLYSEEYNKRYFTQGSHPKGLLNFKGDNWTPDQLESFRRQWIANVAGVENAWKTPITQSEGIEWVNLQMTNKDMEFGQWIEYLVKIICGVFLMDPAEINFDLHGGVQQTPLFESSQEWKLKASRDKGLKPLLRFIAKLINVHIINRIDDHFVFEFVGLDELTEQEKHELLKEQIASYMTLNEGRKSLDLPEVALGDVPLNPNYIQLLQLKQQAEQQKQEMEQQQQAQEQAEAQAQEQGQQPPQEGQEPEGEVPQEVPGNSQVAPQAGPPGQQGQEPPKYADNFGKSMGADRVIKVSLDDWKEHQAMRQKKAFWS